MQATPFRLQQAIRAAFKASKPVRQPGISPRTSPVYRQADLCRPFQPWHNSVAARPFSDKKNASLEEKIKDAQQRVDDAIDARADAVATPQKELKQNETIVHTNPEASSIVHTSSPANRPSTREDARLVSDALPSESKLKQSEIRKHFSHFMDNFQSHVFVASRRLNDLTGYSGIEALKKEIEKQEESVHEARKLVKDTRSKYSAAIDNRSTTQREVNDLLHRKHSWSPEDLQRFTELYRSDHANEQAEQKAHEELSQAESRYEEASTKLAKGILARYHEEQIWSDKIRQMSTWGTWGLMGLNVLLFIVFQVLVEPWRRQRLVKGFEEKVQEALKDNKKDVIDESKVVRADEIVQQAVDEQPRDGIVALAGGKIGEAVADALGGADNSAKETIQVPAKQSIEEAAEEAISTEIARENATTATVMAVSETAEEGGSPNVLPEVEKSSLPGLASNVFAQASAGYAVYENRFREIFNDTEMVVISRRDLTASMLEGAVAGAAIMATVLWAVGKGR